MSEALIPIESHPAVVSLIEDLQGYAEASLSAATRRAYATDLRAFDTWCARTAREHMPASAETVLLYVAELARTPVGGGGRRSVATVKRALSAICEAHVSRGFESPRVHRLFKRILRGLRRKLGAPPVKKTPLLADEVKAIVRALPETVGGARDRALLLLGFAGGFRRSELVAIDVEDLAFVADGLVVTIRRSKTDQEGEGQAVGIPPGSAPEVCPVQAVKDWLLLLKTTPASTARRRRPLPAGRRTPLFREVTRLAQLGPALSDRSVAVVVQRAVASSSAMAGKDPSAYGGHSLRAGFVTSAAKAGKSERKIMEQTRHTSVVTMRGYIREAGLFEENAADGLL